MSLPDLNKEGLGRLSEDLDAYIDWAQVWHRQAGGYMASDTALTVSRISRWADHLQEVTGKPEVPLRRLNPMDAPIMWTAESATRLIQKIHPAAFDVGWNLHLGGGVLTKGYSEKDVDILAMPRWQVHGGEDISAFNNHLTGNLKWVELSSQWLPYRHIFKFRLPEHGQLAEIIYVRPTERDSDLTADAKGP